MRPICPRGSQVVAPIGERPPLSVSSGGSAEPELRSGFSPKAPSSRFSIVGRLPAVAAAGVLAASLVLSGSHGAPLDFERFDALGVQESELPKCEATERQPVYDPLGAEARTRAAAQRGAVESLPVNSEIVREREEAKRLLALLGYRIEGRARIHIEDLSTKHGGEVLRAAVGTSSLAAGADTTLNTSLPDRFWLERVPEEAAKRFQNNRRTIDRISGGEIALDRFGDIAAIWLEQSIYKVSARVERVKNDLPSPWDGRRTFVNMSFATNPYWVATQLAEKMMFAPEGSRTYAEVERTLGHPPRVDRSCAPGKPSSDDVKVLVKELLYPRIRDALRRPDVVERLTAAKAHLERTLASAREVGIIVFKSSGNDRARATTVVGDPSFALDAVAGSELIIEVCAVDLAGPGRKDDRLASFSSPGDVCAAGVSIPVGAGKVGVSKNGTSYASPIAIEAAWVIDALAPKMTPAELVGTLLDEDANTPVPKTDLAGAGRTDLFAAALLARHPWLDEQTIENVRNSLLADPTRENGARLRRWLAQRNIN